MATYTRGQGMETYQRILESARSNDKPIGPQHHRLDKQLREWATKNPETAVKIEATVKKQAEKRQAKQPPASNNTGSLRSRMNNINRKVQAEENLQSKYKAEQRKKIADGYKTPEWQKSVEDIPSRGNGL